MGANPLLRQLPRVDEVLEHPSLAEEADDVPRSALRDAVRESLDVARDAILSGKGTVEIGVDGLAQRALTILQSKSRPSLRRAVNAAGIVLHTGLGRAPLSDAARQAVDEIATGYCNLQADLETGKRTQRETHVLDLLQEITGAESALVVNNNAAATVLVLNTLAAGREVVLSRGEMVEIGGSFRIPDIMKLAGCKLVEVGCTNRTHLRDYEAAMTQETALLLSVHQSNYRIQGFASQVDIAELAALARDKHVACAHDLGSGALVDLREYGLAHEPTVRDSLSAGADCALFSGDKLLGGPQCGIIVGRSPCLEPMRKNPYYRAFRVGKLTLAALDATLRLFRDLEKLPERHRVVGMLTMPVGLIRERARDLASRIHAECGAGFAADVVDGESEIGGGSLAGYSLPTVLVRLKVEGLTAQESARQLRRARPSVFARIRDEALLMDLRTVLPGEETPIIEALRAIRPEVGGG